MHQCARCGHALGVGRYCVNCGQPRDDAAGPPDVPRDATGARDDLTSTAERPAVRVEDQPPRSTDPAGSPWLPDAGPVAPPPVYETPGRPRYPMYADDPPPPPATPATPLAPVSPVPPEAAVPPAVWEAETSVPVAFVGHDDQPTQREAAEHPGHVDDRRGHAARGSGVLPWLVVAVALLLVAGMGVFLLLGNRDDETAADPAPGRSPSASDAGTTAPTSDPPSSPPTSPPTSTAPGPSRDLSGSATVKAPSTAEPGVDVDGNPVRYDAANMLDGRDDTAWRSPGTAAGETIVFTLAGPTRLTSVGLLNGYAKRDPGYDGYTANRRVLEVEWIFDDGSSAPQTLGDSREVQTFKVDVVTTTVRMRLVSVSNPARAPKGRNFTAISTVRLVGSAQR